MIVLREGNNGFTCMPGNLKVVGERPAARWCLDHSHRVGRWEQRAPCKQRVFGEQGGGAGAPPDEIEIACAIVCLPPSDAAQCSRASIEGNKPQRRGERKVRALENRDPGRDNLGFCRQVYRPPWAHSPGCKLFRRLRYSLGAEITTNFTAISLSLRGYADHNRKLSIHLTYQ